MQPSIWEQQAFYFGTDNQVAAELTMEQGMVKCEGDQYNLILCHMNIAGMYYTKLSM
jgi:hypothetical protein